MEPVLELTAALKRLNYYFIHTNVNNAKTGEWEFVINILNYFYFKQHNTYMKLDIQLPMEFINKYEYKGYFYLFRNDLTFEVLSISNDFRTITGKTYQEVATEMQHRMDGIEGGQAFADMIINYATELPLEMANLSD
ncbi:hypothetical protein [Periweissella fabalis]|uniref:Uncharacterized protein n=1 Tax=Periweissella fabalis TaxID=1070421 RepID=A0A7X6N155_9LACO|nr:hypothetical protein [Periweissella fabalis]MCM0599516.1 hypothetical protein [Periweissella fabalis]NKZ23821.1 hypothetical protein [Periweissella fabalis]